MTNAVRLRCVITSVIGFILFSYCLISLIWEKVTSFLYFFQIILFWLSLFQSCSFCMTFINLSLLILVSQRLRSRKKNTADVIICNEYSATIFFFFLFFFVFFLVHKSFYCNFQCQGFSLMLHWVRDVDAINDFISFFPAKITKSCIYDLFLSDKKWKTKLGRKRDYGQSWCGLTASLHHTC